MSTSILRKQIVDWQKKKKWPTLKTSDIIYVFVTNFPKAVSIINKRNVSKKKMHDKPNILHLQTQQTIENFTHKCAP